MSSEANKQLVRRLVDEAINPRNPDAIDEIATDELAQAAKAWASPFRSAFLDFEMVLVDLVAEGDTVVAHFKCSGTHQGESGSASRPPAGGSKASMRSTCSACGTGSSPRPSGSRTT